MLLKPGSVSVDIRLHRGCIQFVYIYLWDASGEAMVV